jgi:hypothetical protein
VSVVPFRPRGSGHSETFNTFCRAILGRQQITCRYQGHYREVCPHILGHSSGVEKALVYQFGGKSSKGLPPNGEWRCLRLSEVSDVELRDGPWHSGTGHSATQRCVEDVYVDVNTAVPNQPGRR